jgi:hypothetical protein
MKKGVISILEDKSSISTGSKRLERKGYWCKNKSIGKIQILSEQRCQLCHIKRVTHLDLYVVIFEKLIQQLPHILRHHRSLSYLSAYPPNL